MSNRLNGKINSSLKKYMNDSINESMRKKMEYYNGVKYTNILKNITYTDTNKINIQKEETTEIEKNSELTVCDNYTNYNKYLYSFVSHFYSKIKTNFFVFLLLIYNGDHNK